MWYTSCVGPQADARPSDRKHKAELWQALCPRRRGQGPDGSLSGS
jgi:hypothetical protein